MSMPSGCVMQRPTLPLPSDNPGRVEPGFSFGILSQTQSTATTAATALLLSHLLASPHRTALQSHLQNNKPLSLSGSQVQFRRGLYKNHWVHTHTHTHTHTGIRSYYNKCWCFLSLKVSARSFAWFPCPSTQST